MKRRCPVGERERWPPSPPPAGAVERLLEAMVEAMFGGELAVSDGVEVQQRFSSAMKEAREVGEVSRRVTELVAPYLGDANFRGWWKRVWGKNLRLLLLFYNAAVQDAEGGARLFEHPPFKGWTLWNGEPPGPHHPAGLSPQQATKGLFVVDAAASTGEEIRGRKLDKRGCFANPFCITMKAKQQDPLRKLSPELQRKSGSQGGRFTLSPKEDWVLAGLDALARHVDDIQLPLPARPPPLHLGHPRGETTWQAVYLPPWCLPVW